MVSQDGTKFVELTGGPCISNDMTSFIKQRISPSEIMRRLEYLREENVTDNVKLLASVTNPSKIVGVSQNYPLYEKEVLPREPAFFTKFNNSIVGPTGNVIAHEHVQVRVDFS